MSVVFTPELAPSLPTIDRAAYAEWREGQELCNRIYLPPQISHIIMAVSLGGKQSHLWHVDRLLDQAILELPSLHPIAAGSTLSASALVQPDSGLIVRPLARQVESLSRQHEAVPPYQLVVVALARQLGMSIVTPDGGNAPSLPTPAQARAA